MYLSRGSIEFLTECNQTAGSSMDIFAVLILYRRVRDEARLAALACIFQLKGCDEAILPIFWMLAAELHQSRKC